MSENPAAPRPEQDVELEREVHAERTFNLAEAIGRLAGPGMMKGVSPMTRYGRPRPPSRTTCAAT